MKLKLVLKGPERLMGAQLEKTLENGSLVVGRSPAAGWVLPDPEKIVSKAHCRIDTDFNGFVLTDTSTNGVHVNDEPVGFGPPRLLSDGDVLRLGDAVVVVRIESAAPSQPVMPPEPAIGIDGPFGTPEPAPPPSVSVPDSPSSAPVPAGAQGAAILDDWWKPDAPLGSVPESNPVDISPQETQDAILHTTTPKESLPSEGGDVAFLVDSLADIDLPALARAVDAASTVLPEDERRRFHERLRDLLKGDGGERS